MMADKAEGSDELADGLKVGVGQGRRKEEEVLAPSG